VETAIGQLVVQLKRHVKCVDGLIEWFEESKSFHAANEARLVLQHIREDSVQLRRAILSERKLVKVDKKHKVRNPMLEVEVVEKSGKPTSFLQQSIDDVEYDDEGDEEDEDGED